MHVKSNRRIFVKQNAMIGSGLLLAGSLLLFTAITLAEESPNPTIKNPTHTLQLIQSQNDKPIEIHVKLFTKDRKKYLANIMPDGQRMESEYIITKDSKFKFQWVAVKREELLAIQFIGNKMADGSFTGKFVALVDGELRKDMSGRFNLKTKKVTP